jgi:hypothetical protein
MPCAILPNANTIQVTTSVALVRFESHLAHAGSVVKANAKMIHGTLTI